MVLWVPDGAWKGFPDRKNLTCDHWQSNFLFLSSSLGKKWLARIVTSLSPYSRKLSLSLAAKGDQRWQRLQSHQENFQGDLWCYLSRHQHICPRGFPVACQYRCRASDHRRCSWRSQCLPVVCLKVGWLSLNLSKLRWLDKQLALSLKNENCQLETALKDMKEQAEWH